ncbi:MAG: hypothetical protein KGM15_11525, partial [Pseudomonadota bacterium]|nr:hypothetical protein [Pseudomonadota bacterium]
MVDRSITRPLAKICAEETAPDPFARLQAHIARRLADAGARDDAEAAAQALRAGEEARREADKAAAHARQRVIQSVAAALKALADGDLTARLDEPELARDYEAATALFGKALFALASSVAAIGARAREITQDADGLTRRAGETAATLAPARAALRAAERQAQAQARA